MAESPDFERLAREMVERMAGAAHVNAGEEAAVIEARLRQIWNLRGAADRATIEVELTTFVGTSIAGPWITHLERAVRGLDR
jgi:hypothetical protein